MALRRCARPGRHDGVCPRRRGAVFHGTAVVRSVGRRTACASRPSGRLHGGSQHPRHRIQQQDDGTLETDHHDRCCNQVRLPGRGLVQGSGADEVPDAALRGAAAVGAMAIRSGGARRPVADASIAWCRRRVAVTRCGRGRRSGVAPPAGGRSDTRRIRRVGGALRRSRRAFEGLPPALLIRDAQFVRWRWLQHPDGDWQVLVAPSNDGPSIDGYIVFAVRDGQGRIVDLLATDVSAMRALVREATRLLTRQRVERVLFELADPRSWSAPGTPSPWLPPPGRRGRRCPPSGGRTGSRQRSSSSPAGTSPSPTPTTSDPFGFPVRRTQESLSRFSRRAVSASRNSKAQQRRSVTMTPGAAAGRRCVPWSAALVCRAVRVVIRARQQKSQPVGHEKVGPDSGRRSATAACAGRRVRPAGLVFATWRHRRRARSPTVRSSSTCALWAGGDTFGRQPRQEIAGCRLTPDLVAQLTEPGIAGVRAVLRCAVLLPNRHQP